MSIGSLIEVTLADLITPPLPWGAASMTTEKRTNTDNAATRKRRSIRDPSAPRFESSVMLRQRNPEALRPGFQGRHDGLMKPDSFANLTPAPGERAFARKTYRRVTRCDGRRVAEFDEVLHLAHERVASAECVGIDHLKKNGCCPCRGFLRPPPARKPRRERFDNECQRKTLVSELDSAERQHRAR